MKARIEKKLSKRLMVEVPMLFNHAFINRDFSEAAYAQGTRVSNCYSVGGERISYLEAPTKIITVWEVWCLIWKYYAVDPGQVKPSTIELIKLARDLNAILDYTRSY